MMRYIHLVHFDTRAFDAQSLEYRQEVDRRALAKNAELEERVVLVHAEAIQSPDTAVLVTRYLTEEGVGEVIDFMPVTSSTEPAEHHRIVRMLRCIRGEMTFDIEIAPRFDYGREPHETQVGEGGVVFRGERTTMAVSIVREPQDEELGRGALDESGDVHVELTLRAGEARGMILDVGSAEARDHLEGPQVGLLRFA